MIAAELEAANKAAAADAEARAADVKRLEVEQAERDAAQAKRDAELAELHALDVAHAEEQARARAAEEAEALALANAAAAADPTVLLRSTSFPRYDSSQKVRFTDGKHTPCKLTNWVKVQLAAGYLTAD